MSESATNPASSSAPRYMKDASRFREVVERFANLVYGTATRVLGDADAAQDVAQHVFTDLLRHAPKIRSEGSLGAWLHRHTVFLALRQQTANRRRAAREAEAHRRWQLDQPASTPPSWMPELDRALNALPDLDRRVLISRFFENLSLQETGAQLGLSEDAAQKRASRALEKLQHLLTRRGVSHLPATALTAAVGTSVVAPAQAATWAGGAWSATAAPLAFSTSSLTTFIAMNTKALLSGAAAATLLTSAVFTPVLWQQRSELAELRQQLHAARPPTAPPPPPRVGTANNATTAGPPTRQQRRAEEQARFNAVRDRSQQWQEAVQQVQDAERKQRALEEMIVALMSDTPNDILAALVAYGATTKVEFDRAPFRLALLPLLKHEDALIRRQALSFLPTVPNEESDIELVRAMAQDPDVGVREAVVSGLFWLSKNDLRHGAGETVLQILNREENPTRSLIHVMWGAQFSPALEEKLVEFARRPSQPEDGQLPYYAVYSCLSTQRNKGPACVDVLIERLSHPDSYNVGGRAAWGLGYGVQSGLGLETRIADAALTVWRNRSDDYLRRQLLKCLSLYGEATHATALEELAAAPAMGQDQRQALLNVAQTIQQRQTSTSESNAIHH